MSILAMSSIWTKSVLIAYEPHLPAPSGRKWGQSEFFALAIQGHAGAQADEKLTLTPFSPRVVRNQEERSALRLDEEFVPERAVDDELEEAGLAARERPLPAPRRLDPSQFL